MSILKERLILYTQIGRYETKGAQPPAEVLKKIADALDTSGDYLLYGNSSDKANAALHEAEVIRYFKEIETLPSEDKAALLRVISAFIRDVKTKQAYASPKLKNSQINREPHPE